MVGYLCERMFNLVQMLLYNRAKKCKQTNKKSVFTSNTFVVIFYSSWTINLFFNKTNVIILLSVISIHIYHECDYNSSSR